jgi:serine-type D-Ala-D-Ala carboxypeptidase (penicillin-binding protein 5/6)
MVMDIFSRSGSRATGAYSGKTYFPPYLATFLVVAVLMAPGAAVAARRHRAETATEQSATAAASNLPGEYAEACVLEPVTGTVIFEADDRKPWPTASLAKMMLMLIVAEKIHDGSLKLTDNVTTSRKAAEMGGSQVYLKEGETFSLDDMMKAVVVHSANDATAAVAEYIAGSTA